MLRDDRGARITRLQAAKIADLMIVAMIITALVIGGYNYYVVTLHPPLEKAEFQVANLTVNPGEAGVEQPITISVNVTNVGEEEGNYSLSLTINDVVKENKAIQLLGGASEIVEFIVSESSVGSYSVKIDGLNGTFIITDAPPPPTLKVSDLIISPNEAWVGDPIKISVKATNIGDEAITYPLAFRVNDVVRETKTIQLSAGENTTVEATVTEYSEGTYYVNAGGLTGRFYIVPTGKHTLMVNTPYVGFSFTLDGKSYNTPYSELLDAGEHTLTVPDTLEFPSGEYLAIYQFTMWGDGVTGPTRTIDLQSRLLLVPKYTKIASCPSLYVWNGTNYVYAAEISAGHGYLGNFDYFREDGTLQFGPVYPWDYIKIDRSQLQPRNVFYDMTITQMWDDIFYLDAIKLIIVDHAPEVDVYSTAGTKRYLLEDQGTIYTVSKNPLPPVSAINGEGEDVLPQIFKLDKIYTTGNQFQYDTLELNLGDLSDAKEIKLIVNGQIVWPPDEETGRYLADFVDKPGVEPFPLQYMEVKDENGNWVRVPDSRQFPYLDVHPGSFVVNLTGLFPTNDYSLRIHTFVIGRFDYIGVDTTLQQDVTIQETYPVYADLSQAFLTNSTSSGNFTRYGDVTQLVLEADDKYIIGRQGDEVHLWFPTDIEPVPENMERDFFVFVNLLFKTYGHPHVPHAVDPLPFQDMSVFPYPPTESYPYDEDHLKYLREYNTREIALRLET